MTDCIIHRDDRLLVLEKPAGLLAVPGRGPDLQDCLAARVQHVVPMTGRSHRIRLHRATLGHPILGDPLYADDETRALALPVLTRRGGLPRRSSAQRTFSSSTRKCSRALGGIGPPGVPRAP